MTPEVCVRIEKLSKTFEVKNPDGTRGFIPAIQLVQEDVREGEFLSIIGPSGCGKSTLLEIVGGLQSPSGGQVFIRGEKVTLPHPAIAMVFQEESIFPWRTVVENVEFGLEIQGVPREVRRARALAIVTLVGLKGFEHRHPRELSGGMKQRTAIARALAKDPELLLMDEPFGALDQQTRIFLGSELLRIWEETGKTIIFVTHDINEAVFLSDRVWVMSARPSVIKETVSVDLGRPRPLKIIGQPRFHELSSHLWSLLREESEKALGR